VKRLLRQFAARAYEAELGRALRALEGEFRRWHSGEIAASELSDRVYAFTRGPARELWSRYNAGLDDMQVAHAITLGLLPHDDLPTALLEALQPVIAFYERNEAVTEHGEE
jgi:hypothetical protein